MYPGFTTRLSRRSVASATTIVADRDLLVLTGTTAIATITPKVPSPTNQSQLLFLLPVDGAVATTTAGNIIAVISMLQNTVTVLVWNPVTSKWYPHALA